VDIVALLSFLALVACWLVLPATTDLAEEHPAINAQPVPAKA
jgi:hypothetical protein